MRGTRFVRLALGTALCIVLLWRAGAGPVLAAFATLSWRLPILLCFPVRLMVACDTLGWRFSFRRDRAPFGTLVSARLVRSHVPLTALGFGAPAGTAREA